MPANMIPPPPSPPVLEYQRRERARKVAIGGLRVLGTLLALVSLVNIVLITSEVLSRRSMIGRAGLAFAVLFFLPGVLKIFCSLLIIRRSSAAARAALILMGFETLLMLYLLFNIVMYVIDDRYDGFVMRYVLSLLVSLILLGLLGWISRCLR
jgi:hypothetical protein